MVVWIQPVALFKLIQFRGARHRTEYGPQLMHARIWRGITCDLFDGGLKMAEECGVDEGGLARARLGCRRRL